MEKQYHLSLTSISVRRDTSSSLTYTEGKTYYIKTQAGLYVHLEQARN